MIFEVVMMRTYIIDGNKFSNTVSLLRPCTSADTVNACLYRLVEGCDIPFGLNIEIAVGNIGIRPVKQF